MFGMDTIIVTNKQFSCSVLMQPPAPALFHSGHCQTSVTCLGQVMALRHLGHEMAVSSVTDDKNLYLKNSSAWTDELAGMRRIMELQVGGA